MIFIGNAAWRRCAIGIVCIWYRPGNDMVLGWYWYGIGAVSPWYYPVFVRNWHGIGMVLV